MEGSSNQVINLNYNSKHLIFNNIKLVILHNIN